ncbi:VWA domain-containing protein [Candidatus Woesearchaeota archaeon]|nr:VWA domain-containing protein [Candidatus Woesearchaeota archaeon]
MIRISNFVIEKPENLLLMIPLIIVFFLLIYKRFYKSYNIQSRKFYRFFLLISKSIIIGLLIVSLAYPVVIRYKTTDQNPKVTILIDNSSSMKLFDSDISHFKGEIEKNNIFVKKMIINTGEITNLGTEILKNLEPEKDLILYSDGYSNSGASLEDVSLIAADMNSAIHAINILPEKKDTSILIEGPDKVISNVENEYIITINRVNHEGDVNLRFIVDDKLIFEKKTNKAKIKTNLSFSQGVHRLKAQISKKDLFKKNNIFYKTVSVAQKPEILLVTSQDTSLSDLVSEYYILSKKESIPDNLDRYYTVILNDISGDDISEDEVESLEEFVAEGNGLFVIGGRNSFDYGNYNQSVLSSLLPVGIGTPKKKKDVVNIVIGIDSGVSGSGKIESENVQFIDIQKALSIDVVNTIAGDSNVGVIELFTDMSGDGPFIISKLSKLQPKKVELTDKISKIKIKGISNIHEGIILARDMLKLERGSKNLILITDGNIGAYDQKNTLMNIRSIVDEGIKTYIIGVGQDADIEFLKNVAREGNGRYFQTDQSNRLNIFFGDMENIPAEDKRELFIYDTNHFITNKIEPELELLGFNSVYPKSNARLLATTMQGDPILTVSRYGLGRIAALSTNPDIWASSLYTKQNSAFLIRTMNWLIESPERKLETIVNFPEFHVNTSSSIIYKAKNPPENTEIDFFEEEDNVFKAYYYPEKQGFSYLINMTIAVNYNQEYENLGFNPELEKILEISGGKLFSDGKEAAQILKTDTKTEVQLNTDVSWIFIAAALIIYLVEITARKTYEIKSRR